jgi:hypothetical protein
MAISVARVSTSSRLLLRSFPAAQRATLSAAAAARFRGAVTAGVAVASPRTLSSSEAPASGANKPEVAAVAETTTARHSQLPPPMPPPPDADFPELIDPVELHPNVRIYNAVLGLALAAFAVGVGAYSMYAVGQAGGNANDGDDPLAALRHEAAVAQQKADADATRLQENEQLVQQFNKGGFDPDDAVLDDDDDYAPSDNNASSAAKKPWWKFWARS